MAKQNRGPLIAILAGVLILLLAELVFDLSGKILGDPTDPIDRIYYGE